MRGATLVILHNFFLQVISIHAPHAGSDEDNSYLRTISGISIHAPHAGSDEDFQ